MQVYGNGHNGGKNIDPNDLLEVQGVAGAAVGWAAAHGVEVVGYLPRAWKGQIPADVHARRIEGYLTSRGWNDGRLEPCPARRRGDLMHGVGVGLHHLGLMVGGRTHR